MTKKVKEQKEEKIDLFKENKKCVCYFDTDQEKEAGHVQGCYFAGKPYGYKKNKMPHQKNPVESLREEFKKKFIVDFGGETKPNLVIESDLMEIADWCLEKFSSHHDQILAEILEEVGEGEKFTMPDLSDVYVVGYGKENTLAEHRINTNARKNRDRAIVNEERARFRSLLLAKKRKDGNN